MMIFFAISHWETLFLNKVANLAPSLLVNDWAFRWCFFYTQAWHSPNGPVPLWNIPNRCFFLAFLNFPSLLWPLSQHFWNMWMSEYLQKKQVYQFEHYTCCLCSVFNWIQVEKRICKSLFYVFIYVLHNVPTSIGIGVCKLYLA